MHLLRKVMRSINPIGIAARPTECDARASALCHLLLSALAAARQELKEKRTALKLCGKINRERERERDRNDPSTRTKENSHSSKDSGLQIPCTVLLLGGTKGKLEAVVCTNSPLTSHTLTHSCALGTHRLTSSMFQMCFKDLVHR